MVKKDINIVLLVGGASAERPVSKLSSESIYKALKSLGYSVTLIDPALGRVQPTEPQDFFGDDTGKAPDKKNYIDIFTLDTVKNADLFFVGLHGKWGEDGTLQSLLEIEGKKYTGSGVLACAVAQDKGMSKIIFKDHDIPVPDGFRIEKGFVDIDELREKIEYTFGFPCVVKPNDEGSTFGLTVCRKPEELNKAVELAFKYSNVTLIEDYIEGRELTVGILGNGYLPVLEIKPKHELYDYECKYTKGMSEYIVPADIPSETAKKIQQASLLANAAVGCSGYSRVDFRYNEKGEWYCLEINPLPGMTSTSLLPKMAAAKGISFEELIDRIVKETL